MCHLSFLDLKISQKGPNLTTNHQKCEHLKILRALEDGSTQRLVMKPRSVKEKAQTYHIHDHKLLLRAKPVHKEIKEQERKQDPEQVLHVQEESDRRQTRKKQQRQAKQPMQAKILRITYLKTSLIIRTTSKTVMTNDKFTK